jgi:hypothetical protein
VLDYYYLSLTNSTFTTLPHPLSQRPVEEEKEEILLSSAPSPSGLQNMQGLQQRLHSLDLINVSFFPEDVH